MGRTAVLLAAAVAGASAASTYLPGAQPNEFVKDQEVPLQVNKLWSAKTQVSARGGHLPP